MRPEDFHNRPTVDPTTKRIYAYGQMLFGAVTAAATIIASVYAFLGNYVTEAELSEALDKNNLDIVTAGKTLPHDTRFRKLEIDLNACRENDVKIQLSLGQLKDTDVETLELLAGYLAADSEPRATLRAMRREEAVKNFRFFLHRGETPIDAFRLAMRPPGSYLR